MVEAFRKFFQTKAGFAVAGGLIVISLLAIFAAFKSSFGETDLERFTSDRVFIDADTGKTFKYELKVGSTVPAPSPHSGGKAVGWPAEACYWTKDGQAKKEPTYVLLNLFKTPGSKEPTFCPDCGRLVVPHNPVPGPDRSPPPTKAEYKPRGGGLDER